MAIVTSNQFYDDLKRLIPNMPDNIISFDLHLKVNSAVTATVEMYTEHQSLDTVIKTYSLYENKPESTPLKYNEWIIDSSEYSGRPWFKSAYMKSIAAHNEIDRMYYDALEYHGISYRNH